MKSLCDDCVTGGQMCASGKEAEAVSQNLGLTAANRFDQLAVLKHGMRAVGCWLLHLADQQNSAEGKNRIG